MGVSNFQPAHLDRIVAETGVAPVVNQIEVHPYFLNDTAREASLRHGTHVEGWSPIAQGKVLDDAVIGRVAEAHGRTPSQVTLRWHVERGDIVFPKSMNVSRMKENFGSSTSRSPPTRSRRSARSTRARPAARAPTRTRSTTSPADRCYGGVPPSAVRGAQPPASRAAASASASSRDRLPLSRTSPPVIASCTDGALTTRPPTTTAT